MENEIVKAPDIPIGQLIELAIERGITTESLERLQMMAERMADRAAEREFNRDFAQFQHDCPLILQSKTANVATNSGRRYQFKYARLSDIVPVIREILHERGFTYSFDSLVDGDRLTCTCTLRHTNGHSITASFPCPIASTSPGMGEAHKHIGALTVARKQALIQVLGLSMTDDDDEEMVGDLTPINKEQIETLETMIAGTKSDRGKFLKFAGVAELSEISVDSYPGLVRALESKMPKGTP